MNGLDLRSNTMDYYFYVTEKIFSDFDNIKEYITRYYGTKKIPVAEITFNDSNYLDFLKVSGIDKILQEYDEDLTVMGADGYLHSISLSGCKRLQIAEGLNKKVLIKSQLKHYKEYINDDKYKQKILNKYTTEEIHKTGYGIAGYNKYIFADSNNGNVIPFRLRKAKNSNRPLVIYFAGGGTIGHDNFKPLSEHINFGKTYKFFKADCNILVPQSMRANCYSEKMARENYIESCTSIISKLIKEYNIDNSRIYIYGCSFGAGCVWNMLVNNHDMITAAIEVMGCYLGYKRPNEIDFSSVAKVPIWMAHSSNDNCVTIDSDDTFYNELKKYTNTIKYTRWDKYGHKMAVRFFRQEKWADWLLNQKKPD